MDCGRKVSEMIQNFITSFMRYSSFWRFLNAHINLFYFFFFCLFWYSNSKKEILKKDSNARFFEEVLLSNSELVNLIYFILTNQLKY